MSKTLMTGNGNSEVAMSVAMLNVALVYLSGMLAVSPFLSHHSTTYHSPILDKHFSLAQPESVQYLEMGQQVKIPLNIAHEPHMATVARSA